MRGVTGSRVCRPARPTFAQDGGGLFKDFMERLIKEGFGGDNGLFVANALVRFGCLPIMMLAPVRQRWVHLGAGG